LLEHILTQQAASLPGEAVRGPIRFASHQTLSFPPGEIHALEPVGTTAPIGARLIVNLMGLTGALGALPQVYTELALKSLHERNPAFTRFLDLFNDRLLNLFHQAWRRYRLPALVESFGRHGTDPVREILYSIAGFGFASLRNLQSFEDESLLYYAGLFGQAPKSAISLERLVGDFTGLPARIEQFQPRRIPIPADEQTRLPGVDRPGHFAQLGIDAVIGEATLDVQGCFRVVLGPLTYRSFLDYLPGRLSVLRLKDLIRTYVGPEFSYEIQLVLRSDQIPACVLGGQSEVEAPRLGWNSWAITLPPLEDADDTLFDADGDAAVWASRYE
jgi:type VI secretion system protein ImpH